MSIHSLYTNFSLFLVPSQATKPPVGQIKNPPLENTQRSGNRVIKYPKLDLPPLLTAEALQTLYPQINDLKQAYFAYFKDLCKKNIFTTWGSQVDLTAHREGSVEKAFIHITHDKNWKTGINVFSPLRAAHLSRLERLLSRNLEQWYKAWSRGRWTKNRMIGVLEDTDYVAIIEDPKHKRQVVNLVTAFPAPDYIDNIKNSPNINNPSTFFQ
jgi:hypothetical protein